MGAAGYLSHPVAPDRIAAGLDAKGCLMVVAINGRIRESVGATHVDMAKIMQSQGCVAALGFRCAPNSHQRN